MVIAVVGRLEARPMVRTAPLAGSKRVAQRHRASGIYGAIVTAAVLAALPDSLSTAAIVVAVVITLVVYWLAEQYAEVLGEQAEGGRLPTWHSVHRSLAATWPLVSSSFLPLLALVIARFAGATMLAASNVGLVCAVLLLIAHAWAAARAADLHHWQLAAATATAAALGLVLVLLKDVVLLHLH
ncbi:MAG TPA: hypothetical protein VFH38_00435 [Jatrophihabitans sp.]|nr:hypothetical protein [Jatrophihabitans sp.]